MRKSCQHTLRITYTVDLITGTHIGTALKSEFDKDKIAPCLTHTTDDSPYRSCHWIGSCIHTTEIVCIMSLSLKQQYIQMALPHKTRFFIAYP